MRLQEQNTQPHYDTYKRKKETKAVNGTSSRHLALADGSIPPNQVWWQDRERPWDHEETGLPASLLSLACRCITISRATQVI